MKACHKLPFIQPNLVPSLFSTALPQCTANYLFTFPSGNIIIFSVLECQQVIMCVVFIIIIIIIIIIIFNI